MQQKQRNIALDEIDFSDVDAMDEAAIQKAAETDPDSPPLSDADFDRMTPVYSPKDIRAIRDRLKLTRAAFARRFHIPERQLQEWEQGRKKPSAAANTLFRVIDKEPEAIDRAFAG